MKPDLIDKDYGAIIEHELELMMEDEVKEDFEQHPEPENGDFIGLLAQNKTRIGKKSVIAGIMSGTILLIFYLILVSGLESLDHAVDFFVEIWYWMVPLTAGFGLQISLFTYVRETMKLKKMAHVSSKKVAATGGVSTFSMVACCAHHAADLLPFIGATTAAVILAQYQAWLILVALISNLLGIVLMLKFIKDHGIYDPQDKTFSWLSDMKRKDALRVGMAIFIVIIVLYVILFSLATYFDNPESSSGFSTQINEKNSITVMATPLDFDDGEDVLFLIQMDTHSVDLSHDMSAVSFLEDSLGNRYEAIGWSGSSPGGHHRKGTLKFPPIDSTTEYIRLTIKDINGADRVFMWDLN